MDVQVIQNKIYEIRGIKVMLDYDLAVLYQTETKRLKEAVRRNKRRFPEDFMLELTKEEYDSLRTQIAALESNITLKPAEMKGSLRTQIATSNKKGRGRHSKYPPFAFSEHGVAMLAAVLNSDKAIDMNLTIIRAFIALKQLAIQHKNFADQLQALREELHGRIDIHDAQLGQIYEAIENLLDQNADRKEKEEAWKNRNRIGFKK